MVAGCVISLVSAALAGWLLIVVGAETPKPGCSAAFLAMVVRLAVVVVLGTRRRSAESSQRQPLLFWIGDGVRGAAPARSETGDSMTAQDDPTPNAQAAEPESPLEHIVQHPLIERPAHLGPLTPDGKITVFSDQIAMIAPGRPAADRAGADAREAPARHERRRRDGAGRAPRTCSRPCASTSGRKSRSRRCTSTPIASSSTSGASSSSC